LAIYGISDLHLSLGTNKPMDIFGMQWLDHHEKIRANWLDIVTDEDIILIPGDISWALTIEEFMPDLEFINSLPGKKILLRGNHDYWWTSLNKVRSILPNNCYALQNDSIILGNDIVLAGSRGWTCPNDREYTQHDQKIYERELIRLELSLADAAKHSCNELWVMMHYMPTNDKHEHNELISLMTRYQVSKVLYGHLHSYGHDIKIEGTHWDIEFHLISCDYINFIPKKIASLI